MLLFLFFLSFSFRYKPKITLDELINLLKFDDIDHVRDFIRSSGRFYALFHLKIRKKFIVFSCLHVIFFTGGVMEGNDVILKDSHKGFVDTYQKF